MKKNMNNTANIMNPIVPAPVPSAGAAKGFSNILSPQTPQFSQAGAVNPILDSAAGPKCNLIWTDSIDKILSHPTSPNEQLYFHDENNPVIYCRETDGNGNVKNPIKALHYTVEEIPFGPEAQFVTKEEHKKLYDLVEKLSGSIDSMNGKLEKLLNG